ncbi:MAG: GNAT family N-acetyltransferase [Prevotellaceae bacterium]|jgi:diamine N-acetyltransferase|nr:GNAT family N-acetyltransferase [Prevotellaceae bacterium]
MKHTYLSSNRIRLRAMEPEDLELILHLENDPDQWDICNFTVPYSRYAVKRYLEETKNDLFADQELRLVIVRRADGAAIGTIDVVDFSPLHKRGEVGIVIGREFRGAGYAKEALLLLCDYAFDYLGLKQLAVHIPTDHAVSLHLFTACGFVQCGLLKEWICVEGTYRDVALLQRINRQTETPPPSSQ